MTFVYKKSNLFLWVTLSALITLMLLYSCSALADTGRIINRNSFKAPTATPQPTATTAAQQQGGNIVKRFNFRAPTDTPAPEVTVRPRNITTRTFGAATQEPAPIPEVPATATPVDTRPVLPDPSGYFYSAGTHLDQKQIIDGVEYDVYIFEYIKRSQDAVANMNAYSWELMYEDFEIEAFPLPDGENGLFTPVDHWFSVSKDGATAYICVNASYMGGSCVTTLYIPDTIAFEINYTPQRIGPDFLNDLDIDVTITDDPSSDTPTICMSCRGSKKCATCKGNRTYRNPYTGDMMDCICYNGDCTVCDGTGVW